jgi:ATP-dependent Zn protease
LALVVEAVTGTTLTVGDDLLREITIKDLALAIRPGDTADECLARLETFSAAASRTIDPGPTLQELPGYSSVRTFALDFVKSIKDYKAGTRSWNEIDNKAALIAGPPGTGKTQLMSAIARSAGVPLIVASPSMWNSVTYLSASLQRISKTFSDARRHQVCVVGIEEVEGIGDRGAMRDEYALYWTQCTNRLLEEISGVDEVGGTTAGGRTGIFVLATTNFPERVDPALRRSGRLDRLVEVGLPSFEDLLEIFRFYMGSDLAGIDLAPAALAGVGRSGADVASWCTRAKAKARGEERNVNLDDLLHEVSEGRERLPAELKRVIALHEAAHVVVGVGLEVFAPRSASVRDDGGQTSSDLAISTRQDRPGIEKFIVMLLAGRAIEHVALGASGRTVGAGAGGAASDLARATKAVVDLELRFGLGSCGVAQFDDGTTEVLTRDPRLVALVRSRLDGLYARSVELVTLNRPAIAAVAERLEARGYLDEPAIKAILQHYAFVTTTDIPTEEQ